MKEQEKGGFRMKSKLLLGILGISMAMPTLKIYARGAGAEPTEGSFFFPLVTSPMAVYFALFLIFWGIVHLMSNRPSETEQKGQSYHPYVAGVLAAIVWFGLFAIDVLWI